MLVLRFPVDVELTRTSCMECSDYQEVANIPFLSTSFFCKKCELSFTFSYCSVSGRLAHLGHDSASIHRSNDSVGFTETADSVGLAVVHWDSNTHSFIYYVTSGTGHFTS